jgi:hypothetical protein
MFARLYLATCAHQDGTKAKAKAPRFQHRVRRSLSPLKAAPELNRSHVCFLAASRVAGVHLHLVG